MTFESGKPELSISGSKPSRVAAAPNSRNGTLKYMQWPAARDLFHGQQKEMMYEFNLIRFHTH